MEGLFAPPPSAQDDRRQAIFKRLKPLTVPILGHVPLRSDSAGALTALLSPLRHEVASFSSADEQVFTPALASYIVFPLSQLLESTPLAQVPDDVLSHVLDILASVVRLWRSCTGGMEEARWVEMLGVGALAIGGPLQASGDVKGKAREKSPRSDDVLRAGTNLLATLVHPLAHVQDDDDDIIGELHDLDLEDPAGPRNGAAPSPRPPSPPVRAIPILFHALTALLDASTSDSVPSRSRRSSLVCAKDVVQSMAAHRAAPPAVSSQEGRDSVASALPGCVSAVCKVCVASHSRSGEVVAALDLFEAVVDLSVGETWPEIRALLLAFEMAEREGGEGRVEELVERWKRRGDDAQTTPQPVVPRQPQPSRTFSRTKAWLARTTHHLSLSLRLLLSALASHHHPTVRIAWTRLCASLLRRLPTVLSLPVPLDGDSPADDPRESEGLQILIEALLRSHGDDWADVSEPARTAFLSLSSRTVVFRKVSEVMFLSLGGLARVVTRRDDTRVHVSATLVTSAAGVLSSSSGRGSSGMPRSHGVERWSGPLLVALELDPPKLLHERGGGGSSDLASRRAFNGVGPGSTVLLLEDTHEAGPAPSKEGEAMFPSMRFKNVGDPKTARALETMLSRLGDVGEGVHGWPDRPALAEHFLTVAAKEGSSAKGLVALLVVVTSIEGVRKKAKQSRFAERMANALVELDVDEGEDAPGEADGDDSRDLIRNETDGRLEVAHLKGNTVFASERFTSLNPSSSSPREDARVLGESRRALRSALVLRGLAACASVLEDSFRPILFTVLYPILTHLVSPEPFVSSFARAALSRIAFDAGYAAPTNLILDNVDYVVDAVSRRLKLPDLDPSAPRVLVGMIQVAGAEVVPLIQDVVEECFDALDDFHRYDFLCANLLAVFDALLKTVGEATEIGPPPKPSRFRKRGPDGEAERSKFERWLAHRRTGEVEPGVDDFPPEYWRPSYIGGEDPSATADVGDDEEGSEPPKPTRTQAVCAEILSKSVPFLSHPSPFLRARALDLLTSGVPILGVRAPRDGSTSGADLLGLVHRSWPVLLNRLDQSLEKDPVVVAGACRFVEALVRHVGEFMGRRVTDDVWVKFKTILKRREDEDEAMSAKRSWEQTTSHRIAASILATLAGVARCVDLKEEFAWEVATGLVGFLRPVEHEELQRLARVAYVGLAEENGDSVWLALTAAAGRVERMGYMAVEGVEANVDLVLAEI